MNKFKIFLLVISSLVVNQKLSAQCEINASAYPIQVCAGENVFLKSVGSCGYLMNNDFNNGTIGVGWSSTAANPVFNNPCGQGPMLAHLWVGTTPSSIRTLETITYDVSIGGCEIKWYMRYGPNGGTSCESPDEPGEGVHLQYSTNNGTTWTDFSGPNLDPVGANTLVPPFSTTLPGTGGYWTPVSGNAATGPLYYWHEYASSVPAAAATTNTKFRWAQLNTSSTGYDAWGIDEVEIVCPNSNVNVLWSTGDTVFTPGFVTTLPHPQNLPYDTCFVVHIWDSINFVGDYDTVCVHVLPVPTPDFVIADTSICDYDSINVLYTGTAPVTATYSWVIAGQPFNTQGPFNLHLPSGSYSAILNLEQSGCTSSLTKSFNVHPKPLIAFTADVYSGCKPLEVSFVNYSSPNNTYLWNFGDGSTSVDVSPDHIYTQSGVYSLKLNAVSNFGCVDSFLVNNFITVFPDPIANFSANPPIVEIDNPEIQYNDMSIGAATWYWDFGDNTDDSTQNPLHHFTNDGDFLTWLYISSDKGCKDSVSYIVRVVINKIIVPNIITPNGDGKNDYFVIKDIEKLESSVLLIYNRWGKKVYESDSYINNWDGDNLADGVYFYVLKYKTLFGSFEKQGTVTIMRN